MDDLAKPKRGIVYRLLALVLALVLGWTFWLLYSMRLNRGLHVPPVVYALLLSSFVLTLLSVVFGGTFGPQRVRVGPWRLLIPSLLMVTFLTASTVFFERDERFRGEFVFSPHPREWVAFDEDGFPVEVSITNTGQRNVPETGAHLENLYAESTGDGRIRVYNEYTPLGFLEGVELAALTGDSVGRGVEPLDTLPNPEEKSGGNWTQADGGQTPGFVHLGHTGKVLAGQTVGFDDGEVFLSQSSQREKIHFSLTVNQFFTQRETGVTFTDVTIRSKMSGNEQRFEVPDWGGLIVDVDGYTYFLKVIEAYHKHGFETVTAGDGSLVRQRKAQYSRFSVMEVQ